MDASTCVICVIPFKCFVVYAISFRWCRCLWKRWYFLLISYCWRIFVFFPLCRSFLHVPSLLFSISEWWLVDCIRIWSNHFMGVWLINSRHRCKKQLYAADATLVIYLLLFSWILILVSCLYTNHFIWIYKVIELSFVYVWIYFILEHWTFHRRWNSFIMRWMNYLDLMRNTTLI